MDVKKGSCRLCIQRNVDWSVDDDLWKQVMTDESLASKFKYDGYICMTCFVKLAIRMGLSPNRWRLSQDPDPDNYLWAKQVIFRYQGEPQPNVWDHIKKPDRAMFVVNNYAGEEIMVVDGEERPTDFTHVETVKDLPCGDHRNLVSIPKTDKEIKEAWERLHENFRDQLRSAIDEWKIKGTSR